MNRGELKARIVFQSGVRVTDGQGGFTVSWAEFATARAKVAREEGTEAFAGGKLVAQQYIEVTCHASDVAGVTELMRISYAGALWNITSIQAEDEARWVVLKAVKGTAQ